MRREAAFPGFSSVSRATGSCLVATLKGAQQVKAHESGPKHLAQRSGRAFVKAQPRSGPGTEARMLGFQNSNTQAQTQAQSRAFNLTPAPPVIAVAARRADVARVCSVPLGAGAFGKAVAGLLDAAASRAREARVLRLRGECGSLRRAGRAGRLGLPEASAAAVVRALCSQRSAITARFPSPCPGNGLLSSFVFFCFRFIYSFIYY